MHTAPTPARPPFAFTLTAPSGWNTVRHDPRNLPDDLLHLLTGDPAGPRATPEEHRDLLDAVDRLVPALTAIGPLATFTRTGTTADRRTHLDVVTLGWLRTAPVLADLDLARALLGRGRRITSGLGPAVLDAEHDRQHVRVAAPVPGSVWLCVVTGVTTDPSGGSVERAVRTFADGLGAARRRAPGAAVAG